MSVIQQTHEAGGSIRSATAAGHWYPRQAGALRSEIDRLMRSANQQHARGELTPGQPKALIAPDAALDVCGQVAAHAYATLEPVYATVQRVVLLGSAGDAGVSGLATPAAEWFDTPLGLVPVDREAVRSLDELPEVAQNERAHEQACCLELHLPFLFHALGAPRAERGAGSGFRIVPVLFGEADERQIIHALDRVWGGCETLIVLSTDLGRHADPAAARQHDGRTIEHILHGKVELLDADDASGHRAVRALMRLTWAHRLYPRLLALQHASGGEGDHVTGYASLAYS